MLVLEGVISALMGSAGMISGVRPDKSSGVICSKSSSQSPIDVASAVWGRPLGINPALNCLPNVRVIVWDGRTSGSVELRREPRRLASRDCIGLLDEDVGPQTSPSIMDSFEERKEKLKAEIDVTFECVLSQ